MTDDSATVEIEIGGTLYVLHPKLSAMKAVNRMAGGYAGAFRRLNDFDVDTMAAIIIAGTGIVGQPARDLADAVYLTDCELMLPKLVRFVNICAAGGRNPDVAPDDVAEGPPAKNSRSPSSSTST